MAKPKQDYRLGIDPQIASRADEVFSRRGIPRTEAVERILSWFLDAPDTIQQDMLGQLPDDVPRESIARLALKHLGKKTD